MYQNVSYAVGEKCSTLNLTNSCQFILGRPTWKALYGRGINRKWLSWDRENYTGPKVTKMGSITGQGIDNNGVGVLRGQRHIPSKNWPKYPPPPGSFETAVSSLEAATNTWNPPPPPKTTKLAKWTTETRQGEFIYLILFKKSNILFHCAILSFVILNSIQCLVECSNSQRPNV